MPRRRPATKRRVWYSKQVRTTLASMPRVGSHVSSRQPRQALPRPHGCGPRVAALNLHQEARAVAEGRVNRVARLARRAPQRDREFCVARVWDDEPRRTSRGGERTGNHSVRAPVSTSEYASQSCGAPPVSGSHDQQRAPAEHRRMPACSKSSPAAAANADFVDTRRARVRGRLWSAACAACAAFAA